MVLNFYSFNRLKIYVSIDIGIPVSYLIIGVRSRLLLSFIPFLGSFSIYCTRANFNNAKKNRSPGKRTQRGNNTTQFQRVYISTKKKHYWKPNKKETNRFLELYTPFLPIEQCLFPSGSLVRWTHTPSDRR